MPAFPVLSLVTMSKHHIVEFRLLALFLSSATLLAVLIWLVIAGGFVTLHFHKEELTL